MITGRIRLTRLVAVVVCALLVPLVAQTQAPELDSDGDGIPDALEQTLLDQFRPAFFVSANDCAAKPARFAPGIASPTVVARDGTIYGQVSPSTTDAGRIEIHYYTLWDRDCGRIGHPLDTEHVSALVAPAPEGKWKAVYWYAGAHEDTVCDISSGARSSALSADDKGPRSGRRLESTLCTSVKNSVAAVAEATGARET